MAVSYKKLRYCLVDEKLTMAKLMRMSRITDNAMRQISKDRDVSYASIRTNSIGSKATKPAIRIFGKKWNQPVSTH